MNSHTRKHSTAYQFRLVGARFIEGLDGSLPSVCLAWKCFGCQVETETIVSERDVETPDSIELEKVLGIMSECVRLTTICNCEDCRDEREE